MGIIFGKINSETPAHKVIKKTDHYEIREYAPAVTAKTYSNEWSEPIRGDKFTGEGFMTLATYIGVWKKGNNVGKVKIPMTAPVLCKDMGDADMVAFFLPKRYTLDTTPQPLDAKVHIEPMAQRIVAVHTFSGSHSMESSKPIAKQFMETLRADNIKAKGDNNWEVGFYNPPFTIPFLRTNEIFVPLADGQSFY